jgi:hypothetical protein
LRQAARAKRTAKLDADNREMRHQIDLNEVRATLRDETRRRRERRRVRRVSETQQQHATSPHALRRPTTPPFAPRPLATSSPSPLVWMFNYGRRPSSAVHDNLPAARLESDQYLVGGLGADAQPAALDQDDRLPYRVTGAISLGVDWEDGPAPPDAGPARRGSGTRVRAPVRRSRQARNLILYQRGDYRTYWV